MTSISPRPSSQHGIPDSSQVLVLKRQAKDIDDIEDALAIETRSLPPLQPGEVLVRAIYISLDPAHIMWIRMTAAYMAIRPGDPMTSQVVGEIMESRADGFEPGELVLVATQIADYSVIGRGGIANKAGEGGILALQKIDTAGGVTPDLYLSLLSHTGFAAMSGIKHVAKVRAGQTVLVSAAAGATGSVAAQLAKSYGARVIGIAGGAEKCAQLVGFYGLDGAVDHRGDVAAQLQELAPEGIDIFFDNVGGALLDTVLTRMNLRGRVVICGSIADYGKDAENTHRFANMSQLISRNIQLSPFWLSDFAEHMDEDAAELRKLYVEGRIKLKPSHILQGLDAAPNAYDLLVNGGNSGKLMLQLGPLP